MKTTTVRMPKNHSERAHALLSASGASRWLNCPPSARLEEEHGRPEPSAYAEEGTLAHEISELFLKRDLDLICEKDFGIRFDELASNEFFSEEMLEYVQIYTDYCLSEFKAAKTDNQYATFEIESKLDLTEYVPESFGTADFSIVNDCILQIVDLKFGKGIPVYANNNKQLMLYALGAIRKYDMLYDITEVKLTIVQPRLNNISTWQISVDELLKWAIEVLKPTAELAFAGQGELNPGDWCRFCAVKSVCRAIADKNLEMAKHDFKKPELLSDEEVADILKKTPELIEWAESVVQYAEKRALEGKIYKGFKLVEGISRRKWDDEDKVVNTIFANCPELSEDEIFETKLRPITQIEKLVGKNRFNTLLSDVVIKPQGKPTLVPIDDKRPALGIEEAINDFKD